MRIHVLSAAGLIGVATGLRSATGVAAVAHTHYGQTMYAARAHQLCGAAILAEAIIDKLPTTPSRLKPPALASRIVIGGLAAYGLARRSDPMITVAAVGIGSVAALAGSHAGAAYRSATTHHVPALAAALAEDAVAHALAYTALTKSAR